MYVSLQIDKYAHLGYTPLRSTISEQLFISSSSLYIDVFANISVYIIFCFSLTCNNIHKHFGDNTLVTFSIQSTTQNGNTDSPRPLENSRNNFLLEK